MENSGGPRVSEELFGEYEGRHVKKFTIANNFGFRLVCTDYGATIISVAAPDRNGNTDEISLCHRNLDDLVNKYGPHFGCLAGRFANRINDGKFAIDGITYQLSKNNNGIHHLHGGRYGFDTKVWRAEIFETDSCATVAFAYHSPHGDELYPGNLIARVAYRLDNENNITMTYTATTDAPTIVNLTNHTYWNLSGNLKSRIYDHELQLSCSRYLPVSETLIPTGELAAVQGTPFDFLAPTALGQNIPKVMGGSKPGIDHCFVVDGALDEQGKFIYDPLLQRQDSTRFLRHVATLTHHASGRQMVVRSTQPGVQVYTANFLSEDPAAAPFIQHNAVCMETQHFPDSINQPHFPSVVLRPGDAETGGYFHQTVHSFRTV